MKFVFTLFILVSCTNPKPIPIWNGKLFVGDSTKMGLSRAQSGEFVPADSEEFNKYIAMSDEDFRSFYTTYVLGCKSWGKDTKLSLRPYKKNLDVVKLLLIKE
jgi:hypothetical protein